MKTPLLPEPLRARIGSTSLLGRHASAGLRDLAHGTVLDAALAAFDGARVLLWTRDQLFAALALIELDGLAAAIVIAPPDLKDEHLASVIARAEIDTLVTDDGAFEIAGLRNARLALPVRTAERVPTGTRRTDWVMFTSGTTGAPKMVAHSLEGLTGAIVPSSSSEPIVWGTFYDIRRYGGLQMLLRALIGHATLVLSDGQEPVADFLARLGQAGVTHMTGTPSHWRRALMSPAISKIMPRYVRLSGEIADQAVLDSLKSQFPKAAMGHAYASTEAGVGFEVTDGLEGFPASFLDRTGPVEMKVVDGALLVRSGRTAGGYVGSSDTLKTDGFVDTGDMVEKRDDRFYFMGRRGGIINVGGLKVHPEEVEAVINRHPRVRLSRVSSRRSPITGAIVVADIVLSGASENKDTIKKEILDTCRSHLSAMKVPAMLRFVPALEITAGGKLARPHA
jgi:acyl-coenzyme A synthetase/AMP-(fatty) acid ligase